MAKLAVIIPAAGSGTRLGSRLPKPFISIEGQSLLELTIRRFLEVERVHQIIVATTLESFERVSPIFLKLHSKRVDFRLVEGGSERQHSIQNALRVLSPEISYVAVHDAVRPFIKADIIDRCLDAAIQWGGAIVGVPAKDTIKRINKELLIQETPDRSALWQAQTPQIFERALLEKAYAEAATDTFLGTDDASLVERVGGAVKMVEGDRENLKITYPVDLKIAELILKEKIRNEKN